MATPFYCKNKRRLQAVRGHGTLNGIDYLEVLDTEAPPGSPRQRTLLVRTVRPLPAGIGGDHVRIDGGVRVTPVRVEWAAPASDAGALFAAGRLSAAERDLFLDQPDPDALLVVRTDADGDYTTYRLRLVQDDGPHPAFDPILAEIDFSFKAECPAEFDCHTEPECPPEAAELPPIDYLAKDYASFRQLMLDRLAVIIPDWQDRSAADLGIAIVEVLAYAADYLSYYQDAVATEAYLGTARRRASVRRHARLLDYPMHDGVNARTWVFFEVNDAADGATLPKVDATGRRTRLLTGVPGGTVIAPERYERVREEYRPEVFELLYDVRLHSAHNRLSFYTWGDESCCLPKGATHATLVHQTEDTFIGHLTNLQPGDVLIFEEIRSPDTGAEADADPAQRHAVRLTKVELTEDPLGGRFLNPPTDDPVPVTEVTWMEADALPSPVCVSARFMEEGIEVLREVSVARGNVGLVDHGRTVDPEVFTPTGKRRFRPVLSELNVTLREVFDPEAWVNFDSTRRSTLSATRALSQDPRRALPAVELLSAEDEDWLPERDLLASDRFDPDFVVELESDGQATLRFGDDVYGRTPEADVTLTATYRIGTGTAGNVGAGGIAHVVTGLDGIDEVRNPLPAMGGTDPESLEAVRQYAPQAFRRQERAVTEADYAKVTERHDEATKAVARRRWTGSWHTHFITVDRRAGRAVDRDFERLLTDHVDRYKLAGHDVEIDPPRFVPLDVAFTVCVKVGYLKSDVKQALLEVFSARDLPDGRRGFFHPDRFTFGQPVYLSQVIAAAMDVTGVRWVAFNEGGPHPGRFHRWGKAPAGELDAGMIAMDRLEIARLDNDPNAPENGKIEFFMEGGL